MNDCGVDELAAMLTNTMTSVPPFAIALGYLGLQRADAMFQWLDRAHDARDVHLVFAPVDPNGIRTAASGVSRQS